ncbi:MAG: peptidoglycan-binding domain-containing protein [Rhizonema sp. NSF051]|nr:peptidoglycan-binding domain-containing protein [Rhizonema sp. NSF051]
MSQQLLANQNMPTLRINVQGQAVTILQLLFNNFHGLQIKVDGIFGQETENAVKDFQGSRNLHLTGIVDFATWEALVNED